MKIDSFSLADISPFLTLAESENWVAESWELEFHLSNYSQGCFAARLADGTAAGYVTALRHDRSGWIGNLIVEHAVRGQGVGERLFVRALEALRSEGVQTVWLTASKSGQRLYEKHGFSRIDTITRWIGTGRQKHTLQNYCDSSATAKRSVSDLDCQVWGDRRDALLAATVSRGTFLLEDSGFTVIQPCGASYQLGPFTALDSGTAEKIFDAAFRLIPLGAKLYLDAPVSNRAALRMFNRKKLRISGTTELMYAGRRPDYRPELLYGLASMGSCG